MPVTVEQLVTPTISVTPTEGAYSFWVTFIGTELTVRLVLVDDEDGHDQRAGRRRRAAGGMMHAGHR